jgi:hypothetical protein
VFSRQFPELPLWSSGQSAWLLTEVPGSIPSASKFPESQWVWNGAHSVFVKINEELLERKVAAAVYKLRLTAVGDTAR